MGPHGKWYPNSASTRKGVIMLCAFLQEKYRPRLLVSRERGWKVWACGNEMQSLSLISCTHFFCDLVSSTVNKIQLYLPNISEL